MKFLSYGRQQITQQDIDAVVEVLKGDFLTQGPAIETFESSMCEKAGSSYAVACANGTAALHLACIAADVGPGDLVIVPAVTFVASANCARFNGAEIIFCDIDEHNMTMSPRHCLQLLEAAKSDGKKVKAVITVDLAGHPCDMQAFASLREQFGFVWIQDACHSLGGAWEDTKGIRWKVGEFPEVDMCVFSFHPVKHITTGEGGMIVTHQQQYAQTMRLYRTHGITKSPEDFKNTAEAFENGLLNPWYYEMQQLGFNYRLTDLQAALGNSQLRRLDQFVFRRKEIATAYRSGFANHPRLNFPLVEENVDHAYHLAVVLIDFTACKKTRSEVMHELKEQEIGSQVHYTPVPLMPFYAENNDVADFPNSMSYYRRALSLPCYPQMTDEDIERVVVAVKDVLS